MFIISALRTLTRRGSCILLQVFFQWRRIPPSVGIHMALLLLRGSRSSSSSGSIPHSSSVRVASSIMPVAGRPLSLWKRSTASSVRGPKALSSLLGPRYPRRISVFWMNSTAMPSSPCWMKQRQASSPHTQVTSAAAQPHWSSASRMISSFLMPFPLPIGEHYSTGRVCCKGDNRKKQRALRRGKQAISDVASVTKKSEKNEI